MPLTDEIAGWDLWGHRKVRLGSWNSGDSLLIYI